jgi:SAM-dependent methyltransferase
MVRAVEARFYQDIDLPSPTLDVGCGDGHFASVTFTRKLEVGLDPWEGPLRKAARLNAYNGLVLADGAQAPFSDALFASAVSNSVLEHIPHVEAVLEETARLLKPGAPFIFCVPNHQFLSALSVSNACDQIGLRLLGNAYRAFFNRISRHQHCDPPEVWQARLEASGFHLERWWHYFSPQAFHWVEWGHYFGLPSLVIHWLTGKWIIAPAHWNLILTDRLIRRFYEQDAKCEQGVYTFYIARRN